MIDVKVDIFGIVMNCDESALGLNIGNGYTLEKLYFETLPYKDRITDARGVLSNSYYSSKMSDEKGIYFICLKKHAIFQLDDYHPTPWKVIAIDDKVLSEQIEPYKAAEMEYLYQTFAILRLFKSGNIGFCDVIFDFSYKIFGIINNNVITSSHSQSRNIIDNRKYILQGSELVDCNRFIASNRGAPFNLLKPSIDKFVWGLEQIDVPTGFEQYTTALEMTLLEKDAQCKKKKLANRVAILLGSSTADVRQLHGEMLNYYRFRSESLHEGDGSNISFIELQHLEDIARRVLCECLKRCKAGTGCDVMVTWATIKQSLIDDLITRVTAAIAAGTFPG